MGDGTLPSIADLARRALPFLRDEAANYEDDGSNEPLELAREIEAALTREAPAEGVSACDYVSGKLDLSSPARIWLQIDLMGDNDDRDDEYPGADCVTWQDESLGGLEIQYIRADLVATPPAPQRLADYPGCSGDPASCPENEGHGCCKPNPVCSCPSGDGSLRHPCPVHPQRLAQGECRHSLWSPAGGYCLDCGYSPVGPDEESAIDAAVGLTKVVLRLPVDLLGEIDHRAQQSGCVRNAYLRQLLAEHHSQPPHHDRGEVFPGSAEHLLRAMVRNYGNGHAWDKLDAAACTQAADEIASLRAALTEAKQQDNRALAESVFNIPVPARGFHEGWRDEEIWQWALRAAAAHILGTTQSEAEKLLTTSSTGEPEAKQQGRTEPEVCPQCFWVNPKQQGPGEAVAYRVVGPDGAPCPAFGKWVDVGFWHSSPAIRPVLREGFRYEYAYAGSPQVEAKRQTLTQAWDAINEAKRQTGDDLLRAIADNYWKVDPFDMPMPGGDDADVGWRISEYLRHGQRVVVECYRDDLPGAIREAIAASAKPSGGASHA